MPPIQGYEASLEAARRLLEAAETALPKDIAQAVTNAPWARILRDKHDVSALIDKIGELAREEHFVSALHATADKLRQQQPQRGRPPKANNGAAYDHEHAGADASALVPL
jgi:hypothetical protein